jgi:hypothetical protein
LLLPAPPGWSQFLPLIPALEDKEENEEGDPKKDEEDD